MRASRQSSCRYPVASERNRSSRAALTAALVGSQPSSSPSRESRASASGVLAVVRSSTSAETPRGRPGGRARTCRAWSRAGQALRRSSDYVGVSASRAGGSSTTGRRQDRSSANDRWKRSQVARGPGDPEPASQETREGPGGYPPRTIEPGLRPIGHRACSSGTGAGLPGDQDVPGTTKEGGLTRAPSVRTQWDEEQHVTQRRTHGSWHETPQRRRHESFEPRHWLRFTASFARRPFVV